MPKTQAFDIIKPKSKRIKPYRRYTTNPLYPQFAKWLVETFHLKAGDSILDVAGGDGRLAWELGFVYGMAVHVIDPKPMRLSKEKTKHLFRLSSSLPVQDEDAQSVHNNNTSVIKINKKYLERFHKSEDEIAGCYSYLKSIGFRQTLSKIEDIDLDFSEYTVIVGLHPDQATDIVVDLGLKYNRPFVVVPCCVFPEELPRDGTVFSTKDLVKYLLRKDKRISLGKVPMVGNNDAVYWRPEPEEGEEEEIQSAALLESISIQYNVPVRI